MNEIQNINEWRISLLGKIIFANNFLKDILQYETQIFEHYEQTKSREARQNLLKYNTQVESNMMLIVNYLTELIGNRKSNRYSLYNDIAMKNSVRWRTFYNDNRSDIYKLIDTRNHLYAHFNPFYANAVKGLPIWFFPLIDNAIVVLKDIFKTTSD